MKKTLKGEVLTVIHSDHHVGSIIGLAPPKWHISKGDERIELTQSAVQAMIYEQWTGVWTRAIAAKLPIVSINNADNIEGYHHGTEDIWSLDPQEQSDVAVELFMKWRQKCVRWYSTRGTPSHVGQRGKWDEYIAKEVGSESRNGQFSFYHLKTEISGVSFDIAHHGPKPGRRPWTEGNSLRGFTQGIVDGCLKRGERPPDIVIRSHVHHKLHEVVVDQTTGHVCHAIITPALQAKGEYATKVFTDSDLAHIGAAIVRVCDGKVLDVKFDWLDLPNSTRMTA